jgi:hypothetical protein
MAEMVERAGEDVRGSIVNTEIMHDWARVKESPFLTRAGMRMRVIRLRWRSRGIGSQRKRSGMRVEVGFLDLLHVESCIQSLIHQL